MNVIWPGRLRNFPAWLFLGIALAAVSLVATYIPSPIFIRYFCSPLPFWALLPAFASAENKRLNRSLLSALLGLMVLFALKENARTYFSFSPASLRTGDLAVMRAHRDAIDIRKAMEARGLGLTLATPYSLYALESGLKIYDEFAASVFLYSMADSIPEKERQLLKTTSPSSLQAFLESKKPRAIFVGLDKKIDPGFIQYAEQKHCQRIDLDKPGWMLFACSQ